jgi:hypothetical protein
MHIYSFVVNRSKVFNLPYKVFLSVCLLVGYSASQVPPCFSQSLGQSDWQTPNQSSGQSGQALGQSDWQNSAGNAQSFSQVPGLTPNAAGSAAPPAYNQGGGAAPNLGQSAWQNTNPPATQNQFNSQSGQPNGNAGLGLSPWQQPQNSVQANTNQSPNGQQNSDYYYGQINQNQANPNAFGTGQYSGQANSNQPNNQYSSNLPPASSIPAQQQTQQSQGGGLKSALTGFAKAAGLGMGVAAPLAGVYMMTRAMTNSYGGYGIPAMPYGYGYPGMAMPMTYAAPNYAMMNMAPMYSSALTGLSSFMTH